MVRYLAQRLLRAMLLLLAVSALSFCLSEIAPGDYFDEFQLNPAISEVAIQKLRVHHGLDRSLPWRYARWLGSAVQGDWGYSVAFNAPAAPILWERTRNTLVLTCTSVACAWMIGVPIGIWVAAGRRWKRGVATVAVSTLLTLPDLLIVLLLVLLAVHWRVVPIGGMMSLDFGEMSFTGKLQDLAAHLVLPVTALVLSLLPALVSQTRSALAEVIPLPFIVSARANGIPERRLLLRHALPAAANPLITLLGFSIGTLLSSALLVEVTLAWPGLGQLLFQAVLQRDLILVVGAVMLSAVLLVAGSLLADLMLYAADPRIR